MPDEPTRPMSDFHCVEPLVQAMDAAWRHDATDAVAALDRAEAFLPNRYHASRDPIERARAAARAGEWVACWSLAHSATNTLTFNWPPDLSVCPPRPDPDVPGVARAGVPCGSCGQSLVRHARFCPACGAQVSA